MPPQTGEKREIYHFHYTTWPDFGVPESPASFLNFLFKVRESGALGMDHGPAVVHCSAGIGRSGTFSLVDTCVVLVSRLSSFQWPFFKLNNLESFKFFSPICHFVRSQIFLENVDSIERFLKWNRLICYKKTVPEMFNRIFCQSTNKKWLTVLRFGIFFPPDIWANLLPCPVQMDKRKDPSSVDIKSILLDMRKYRMGLIQTPDQLRFSYMAVLEVAKSIMGDSSIQVCASKMIMVWIMN